jgi:hypothetical protein
VERALIPPEQDTLPAPEPEAAVLEVVAVEDVVTPAPKSLPMPAPEQDDFPAPDPDAEVLVQAVVEDAAPQAPEPEGTRRELNCAFASQ